MDARKLLGSELRAGCMDQTRLFTDFKVLGHHPGNIEPGLGSGSRAHPQGSLETERPKNGGTEHAGRAGQNPAPEAW